MKRLFKGTGILLLVLLAVLIIAPIFLKGRIGAIVKHEANQLLTAKLDFDDLNISVLRNFPNASLRLDELTLVGTGDFEGDTIVASERIRVVVDLMSLFGDEGFEVKRVLLDRPAIHGHKLADGRVNWDVMKPTDEPEEVVEEEEEPTEGSAFRLAIHSVEIREAALRYEDDSTGMRFATAPLGLKLRGDLSAERSDLEVAMTAEQILFVSEGATLVNGLEAEFRAALHADFEKMRFELADNLLRLNAVELALNGWVEMQEHDALMMDLTLNTSQLRFRELLSMIPAFYLNDFKSLKASGNLALSAWARGTMVGESLPAFGLKLDVTDGSFHYTSLPESVEAIRLAAEVNNPGGTLDQTVIDLKELSAMLAGNSLTASLHATTPLSDLAFRMAASGRLDLGAIGRVYPLEEGVNLNGTVQLDVKAAGRMSDIRQQRFADMEAGGSLLVEQLAVALPELPEVKIGRALASVSPAALTLGEFNATVGRSDLSAKGQLSNYLGWLLDDTTLAGRLYLHSSLLDLNELLSVVTSSEEETALADELVKPTIEPTPFAVPDNLDFTLEVALDRILFQQMDLNALRGDVCMKQGVVKLTNLSFQAFDGAATASGSYSTASDPHNPSLDMQLRFTDASFERTFRELEMVRKLVPLFEKTGGNYSLAMDFKTLLDASMTPDLQTLSASGSIRSANIRLQNIKAFDLLAQTTKNDQFRKLEAENVLIKFRIDDGRITTQPFDLKLGKTTLSLSGSTGLDQTIDYSVKIALPQPVAGGAVQTLNATIGGTFSDPKISLGLKEAVQEQVEAVVEEVKAQAEAKVEEVKEQVQERVDEAKVQANAELDRQAERLRAEARAAGEKLVTAAEQQRQALIDKAKNPIAKKAAEAAGDALVSEARKQTDKLVAEAEAKITDLRAKAELK